MHRIAIVAVLAGLAWTSAASAQTPSIVTNVEGNVMVRRAGRPDAVPLKFSDELRRHDTVVTGDGGRVRILVGDKAAVVTVDERSVLTSAGQSGATLLDLQAGKLVLAVVGDKLRAGEPIRVHAPNAGAAVSDSAVVVVETARRVAQSGTGAAASTTSFHVLRGALTAYPLNLPTGQTSGAPVRVGTRQTYSAVGSAPARVFDVLAGQETPNTMRFAPVAPRSNGTANEQVKAQALQTAVALLTVLAGSGPAATREGAPAFGDAASDRSDRAPLEALSFSGLTLESPSAPAPNVTPPATVIPPVVTPPAEIVTPTPGTPVGTPEVLVLGVARALTAPLKQFSDASSRTVTSPLALVTQGATVTGPSSGDFIQVNPAASATLVGTLLQISGTSTVTSSNAGFNAAVAGLSIGSQTRAVAITPDGTRAYITKGALNQVTVVNLSTNAVITNIAVGAGPREIEINPAGTRAYVTNHDAATVSVINLSTNTVIATVTVGNFAAGLAVSPDGTRVYAGSFAADSVAVINASTNAVIATVAIGSDPNQIAINPAGTRAYVATSGDIKVLDLSTNTIVATIATGTASQGLAVTPDGTRVYAAHQNLNTVAVISTATNTVLATIPVGTRPLFVAITPDGTRAYVSNQNGASVSVINLASNTVIATLTVSNNPRGVTLSPDGKRLFVASGSSTTVTVLDTDPGATILTVAAGAQLSSSGTDAVLSFDASTVNAGTALVKASGRSTATASEVAENGVTMPTGSDEPIVLGGALVHAAGSTVTSQKGVLLDNLLLQASAPLLNFVAGSTVTTNVDALDLSFRAKVTSIGPVVKLDASTLTVTRGAAVSVGGGSILRITGDLVHLANGSTLRVLSGPLLNVAGDSVVNISGALVRFSGTGGNQVNVTNALCGGACTVIGGIPVHLSGGATAGQVTIGANPITDTSLGTIVKSSPTATALIAVSGAASRVIVTAP